MHIEDYEFHIGDEVITTEGEKGKIISICRCDKCKERGFYEPVWISEQDEITYYITNFVAQCGFDGYYKIGKYIFNNLDKAAVLRDIALLKRDLEMYEKQLRFIEEIENNKIHV